MGGKKKHVKQLEKQFVGNTQGSASAQPYWAQQERYFVGRKVYLRKSHEGKGERRTGYGFTAVWQGSLCMKWDLNPLLEEVRTSWLTVSFVCPLTR